ncbi:hypothetical protein D3C87_1695280 [compost metagenome]
MLLCGVLLHVNKCLQNDTAKIYRNAHPTASVRDDNKNRPLDASFQNDYAQRLTENKTRHHQQVHS